MRSVQRVCNGHRAGFFGLGHFRFSADRVKATIVPGALGVAMKLMLVVFGG